MLAAGDPELLIAPDNPEELLRLPTAGAPHSDPLQDPQRCRIRGQRLRPHRLQAQYVEGVVESGPRDRGAESLPPAGARTDRIAELAFYRVRAMKIDVADQHLISLGSQPQQLGWRGAHQTGPERAQLDIGEAGAPPGVLDEAWVFAPGSEDRDIGLVKRAQADHRGGTHPHSLAGGSVEA